MSCTGKFWLLAACVAPALLAHPARGQKPKEPFTLTGRWETRQLGFAITPATPDSVRDKLDNPAMADFNQAIFAGEAHLTVEFRADSTYEFTIVRSGQLIRTETGTYSLIRGHLRASSPGSADGSSFNDQQVQRLARRTLVLAFPAGPELPGVDEEVEYRRVGPYPATK